MWAKLKIWWENRKNVVMDFVLPQLDKAVIPLSKFIQSKGIPKEVADKAADYVVDWLNDYLKKQL